MRPQKILNISIIAPVLDEGDRIGPFLQHLRQRASPAELIVVTGWCARQLAVAHRNLRPNVDGSSCARVANERWCGRG